MEGAEACSVLSLHQSLCGMVPRAGKVVVFARSLLVCAGRHFLLGLLHGAWTPRELPG